jgi:hypothetical protein
MSHGGALTVGKELVRANILWIRDKKIGIQKDYEKWDGTKLNGDKVSRPFRTRNPFRRRNIPKTEPKPFRGRNETIPPAELNHSAEGMVFRRAKDSIKTSKDTIVAPAGAGVVPGSSEPHPNGSKQEKPLTNVQKIVEGWKMLNNIPHEDKAWDKIHFPRCSKSAKSLLDLFGNLNDALGCMEFVFNDLTKKELTCTIETVVKHSDRYRKHVSGRPG